MTYFFKKPFGENGDITQIPTDDQGDGNVSYEKGWGEGYELDPNVDPDEARNLSRTNFNGLFFNITSALQQFQKYGVNPYITSQDNGGEDFAYDLGGMCSYVDPETNEYGVYYSLRSNNTTVPSVNGVTTKFWQRVFQADLDSIKSNRLYSSLLYYETRPNAVANNGQYIFTIYEDTKCLFSNGLSDDSSLKNDIIQFTNSVSKSVTTDGRYIFFATSNEDMLLIDHTQFGFVYTDQDAIEYFGETSNTDCYYFNNNENRWKIRRAGNDSFENLDYSLCLIGIIDAINGKATEGEFGILYPFRMLSEFEIEKRLEKKQNMLVPGRHLSIEKMSSTQDMLKVNLIADTTHFCVNSCNIDSEGDIDLLYIDTKLVPVVDYELINVEYKVSKLVTQNIISSFGSNGSITYGSYIQNPKNAFGSSSYYTNFVTTGTPRNASSYLYFTFTTQPQIIGETILTYSYNFPSGYCNYGYNHRNRSMSVYVYFSDGTYYKCESTSNYSSNGSGWVNRKITIPNTYKNRYIASIRFSVTLDIYCNYSKNSLQLQLTNVQLIMEKEVWETMVKQEEIEKWHDEWVGKSNKVYFKTGSNYYDLLSDPENATPMLDLDHAKITSSIHNFDEIWGSPNIIVKFSDWWTNFYTEYEFLVTPPETNNCKLVFRYNDVDAEGVLNNLSIFITYWGGATYTLCDKITILKTQDVMLSIPDGKYLQKITIVADEMENLGGSSLGMVNVYNNVANGLDFVQYPAIYASSADGNIYFMQNNVPTIVVEHSGYVMLSESGAYILPGTNVIRKQKHMPTVSDEPKLTNGDVWLDISSEPLRAYQYYNGTWLIFNDVPVGYVTAEYLDPIATPEITSETITAATVNAETFKSQVESDGVYEFVYNTDNWELDEEIISLNTYGISITGTPTDGDIILVSFSIGTLTVTSVEQYPINQNGYNVNIYTETTAALTGKDGRDGQDGKDGRDGKNGATGPQGPAGIGIPTGGLTGQILAKASNANYVTKWTNMISTALFDGGQAGQTLVKNSSEDLDFSWGTIEVLPTGGTSGQALVKDSNVDRDVSWQTLHEIPDGGIANQVLTKLSNENQDVAWMNPGGGVSQASLDKMDFKTSMYFKASVDGYTNLLLEQFIGLDGVSTLDRANVLSYYSTINCIINNTSGEDLVFRLIEMSFSQAINYMELEADYTGTVTFKYSLDSGETYVNFPEDQMIQTTVSTLIIKVEMANEATLSNIAIFTK